MTTNMNFGPEWMRGNLPKHNHTTSTASNNNVFASSSTTTNENDAYSSFDQQQQQQESSNYRQQQQQQAENNPFKYSKEFMLNLYKLDHQLPFDFKQHEYVTRTQDQPCYAPLAFEELTETEKKLLSGPVHSEVSQRRGDKASNRHHRNNNNLQDYSPMQSPVNENGPGRLGQRKGRTGDYVNANKDQSSFKQRGMGSGNESELLKRRDQGGLDDLNLSSLKLDHSSDEGGKVATSADWTSVGLGNGLGSASAFSGGGSSAGGLFGTHTNETSSPFQSDMLFGGNTTGSGLSSLVPPPPPAPGLGTATFKKPEEIKWFYRDPSGQVQGPFEAQEMQDWYKAGFFTPTLMLRREDESVFEPLMVLTQKLGNDNDPFLQPRPSASASSTQQATARIDHIFGPPPPPATTDGLFQSKYMPFGAGQQPTTPGGSLMDSFLSGGSGGASYSYNNTFTPGGGSLLNNNRWDQPQPSPSWLNPTTNSPLGPFGGGGHHQNVFGGAATTPSSSLTSPGLFDYNRPTELVIDHQQQQYMNLLQQNQQQRSMQFQQQFNQFPPPPPPPPPGPPAPPASSSVGVPDQQQQQQQQQAFNKNVVQLENFGGSNHASPVLTRPNLNNNSTISQSGGWGSSVPGTPVGDVPSSPWGSIVSTAIPTKVSEELQAKAPGAQSPRAPSSPNKKVAIEKPTMVKPAPINTLPTPSATPVVATAQQPSVIPVVTQKPVPSVATVAPVSTPGKVYSFAEIQLEEQEKTAAAAAASKKVAQAVVTQTTEPQQQPTTTTTITTTKTTVATPAKPIVSLREIQQEELRIANEKKKQKATQISTPSWAASNSTPLSSTTSGGSWSQPSHKPLSLREIQELEAKEALQKKKKEPSAAEYLTQQQALANAIPSTLSWGVVVPNHSKSSLVNSPSSGNGDVNNGIVWTAPSGPKKTLREIQQEEELAMKKKNARAVKTNTAAGQTQTSFTPKTYATAPAGTGWTTVTSVRTPKSTPSVVTPPITPAVTNSMTQQPTIIKPSVMQQTQKPRGPSEDFRRWCKSALRDLNSGVNQEEIISMLVSFPVDNNASEIIEDVIYANSLRIDGKRFAQEFMKRRRADMAGRYDIVTAGLNDHEEDVNDFKVVTTKKGKKKL